MASEKRNIEKDIVYINPLNKSLQVFFKNALSVSLKSPAQAFYFLKTVRWQQKASKIRAHWKEQGVLVPPIMIYSITNGCNLRCKGCYHQALRQISRQELSDDKMRSVIAEARELGISFMVIAGGEPLLRAEILEIIRGYPDVIFFMFTNGMLIDDGLIEEIKKLRNLVPIISLEGYRDDTDRRRGNGVYGRLKETTEKLKRNRVFFGTSITVTSRNFCTVTDKLFIANMIQRGCNLFLFAEYTPITEGTEDWIISDEQRSSLAQTMRSFRSLFPALFISVPGDEKEFGGCLSAGRGFVHVSAEGDVEPCPFAPYSDSNLRDMSLTEALRSRFLKAVRENEELLSGGHGGCALWENRNVVQSMLANSEINLADILNKKEGACSKV